MRLVDALIAGILFLAHIVAIRTFERPGEVHGGAIADRPTPTMAIVMLAAGKRAGSVPLPILRLSTPSLSTLLDITFESPDAGVIPGVIGALSAPQPTLSDHLDASIYALRAGLVAGESATVVLSVEVHADGSVGEVMIQSSSGSASVDQKPQRWFARCGGCRVQPIDAL